MKTVKKNFEALDKRLTELRLEYYKLVILELAKLCKKHNCKFDTNGGVNFFTESGEDIENAIENYSELIEMKDFLYENENAFGLPDVWFEDGKFIGDFEKELNAAMYKK